MNWYKKAQAKEAPGMTAGWAKYRNAKLYFDKFPPDSSVSPNADISVVKGNSTYPIRNLLWLLGFNWYEEKKYWWMYLTKYKSNERKILEALKYKGVDIMNAEISPSITIEAFKEYLKDPLTQLAMAVRTPSKYQPAGSQKPSQTKMLEKAKQWFQEVMRRVARWINQPYPPDSKPSKSQVQTMLALQNQPFSLSTVSQLFQLYGSALNVG